MHMFSLVFDLNAAENLSGDNLVKRHARINV